LCDLKPIGTWVKIVEKKELNLGDGILFSALKTPAIAL